MSEYCFGIIDENMEESLTIQRTILINKPSYVSEDQITFKEFSLSGAADNLPKEVSDEVMDCVSSGEIQSLIVDYQLLIQAETVAETIEGTEIFQRVTALVPKFPVVLLTNLPEDCLEKEFVDADKVYSKRSFFKVDEEYSKEKVSNLFNNISKYLSARNRLDVSLHEALLNMEEEGYTQEVFQKIVELERQLDDYLPMEIGQLEKALDVSQLQDAVSLIQEAKDLLGDTDET